MCVCGAGRGGVVFPPLFSAVDLELRKYMFLPPAFMCMEWLSAVKKKKEEEEGRNCTASERSWQSDDPPRTPPILQEEIITPAEIQPPPCSPCGASVAHSV